MKNKIVKNFIIFLIITIFFSSLTLVFKNNMSIKRKNTIKTINKVEVVTSKVEQKNNVKTVKKDANETSNNTDIIVHRYCKIYGIEPHLVKAIIHVESNGKHNVTSSGGAIGIMQLTPSTAKFLGVNPYDKEQNIHGGVKYISYLHKKFDGDIIKIIASYNAGETVVKKYNGVPPYQETHNYVNKVLKKRNEILNTNGGKTI